MKWRLQEGEGEAIYEIGVEDNGMFVGLTREELDSSLSTLNVMASKLGAHTTLLRRHVVENIINGPPSRQVAEVLVRRVPDDQQVSDVLFLSDTKFKITGKLLDIGLPFTREKATGETFSCCQRHIY